MPALSSQDTLAGSAEEEDPLLKPEWGPYIDGYWANFIKYDLAGVGGIFAGIHGLKLCPAVPSLGPYLLSFMLVQSIKNFCHAAFKVSKVAGKVDQSRPIAGFINFLGASTLGLLIWGIIVTYPNLGKVAPGECDATTFYTAFGVTTLVVVILIGMLIAYLLGIGPYEVKAPETTEGSSVTKL